MNTTIERPIETHPLAAGGLIDNSALERKLAAIRAKSEAFERAIATAPQTRPCADCGKAAALDSEAAWKRGELVYHCQHCAGQAKAKELAERIERAGIPADVRGATFDNFRVDRPAVKSGNNFPGHKTPLQFLESAKAFAVGFHRNLILAGTPGIGKGHLAAAVAILFLSRNLRVAWVECAKLFRDYHRAYETKTNESITDRLGTVALLVLDEICLRDLPADGEEILFAILDKRHKGGKQTILLSNKPADEIRVWVGDRIRDRLRSGGIAFCFGEWESMRGGECDGAQKLEF